MRAWLVWCSLLLVACDDPEPETPTEIVDTTTAPEDTTPADPPPTPDRADETPTPEPPRTANDDGEDPADDEELLADGEDPDEDEALDDDDEPSTLRFGAVRAREVDLRHRRLADELAAALSHASHATAAARTGGVDEEDLSIEASGSCRASWVGKHLARVTCIDRVINREDWSEHHVTHHFTVTDGELAPVAPDALFRSREAIHARLAEQ